MLLGSNASAGVIAFYANRRRYRLEGSLEASYGSFGTYGAKAVVNAPLTADVALRVAGQYSHSDGYARNIRTGEKLQGGERYRGRTQSQERKGEGEGKSGSVSVELRGCRTIKKQKNQTTIININ